MSTILCDRCQSVIDNGGCILIFDDLRSVAVPEITKEMSHTFGFEPKIYHGIPAELAGELLDRIAL